MYTAEQVVDALEKVWGELTDARYDSLVDCLSTNHSFPMSSSMVREKFGTATFDQLDPQMFLFRTQYDWLVKNYPTFMTTRFPKYKQNWSLGGVRVSASDEMIRELSSYLSRG